MSADTACRVVFLLASSPTVAGISRLVDEYFGGGGWTVDPETLAILTPKGDPSGRGHRVIRRGRRFRFEDVEFSS